MGENTEIQWCTHTFNGWLGCAKVSPACDFCYAERGSARLDVILNARLPNHEGVIGKALNGNTLALKDSHGGDLMEWADDLRVRQFPTGAT